MFWKVAGFSQPSPIEQILERDEFTLEELLDEDDMIQECKSLNGRLIAFLRERSTVEQLIRYLIEPAKDTDDPKRTYKYPFTSCEIFCCEVEAVFSTLLKDHDLMRLLFSILETDEPLNSKTAGYFGRVITHLLSMRAHDVMLFLQGDPSILDKLIHHISTTSIADILKRIVGADEQSGIMFMSAFGQWLSETKILPLLLEQLSSGHSAEQQANAADILTAVANNQPSPLVNKLTQPECISALFDNALAPASSVLVPALDVCCALLEPRRSGQEMDGGLADASMRARQDAANAIVSHVPKLITYLQAEQPGVTQLTPYGVLSPPLGRARLKVVELLAVLLRVGDSCAEAVMISSGAVRLCMDLFAKYPFNNMLHHSVAGMLNAALSRSSPPLIAHLFSECAFLDWLVGLPQIVRPAPRPGTEELVAGRAPLRAGYCGHVTAIATQLQNINVASQQLGAGDQASLHSLLSQHAGWQTYLETVLRPRLDLENVSRWACGRPSNNDMTTVDSDQDEFQHALEIEHLASTAHSASLYHRYGASDDKDDEDEDEGDGNESMPLPGLDNGVINASTVADQLSCMDLRDTADGGEEGVPSTSTPLHPDDDDVLIAVGDDDQPQEPQPSTSSTPPSPAAASPSPEAEPPPHNALPLTPEELSGILAQGVQSPTGTEAQQFTDTHFWKETWMPEFPEPPPA